jgi:biopolymer transport protein ExbD
MAINVGGMNGGGTIRGRRSRGPRALSEINVTPFVDVALVLLIIFMITAHVMEYGIEIDVPKTKTVAASTKDLPIVQITKSAQLYLGRDQVNINNLASELHRKYPGQKAVYLRGSSQASFGDVASVMAVLADAKMDVNVVTQTDDNIGKRR